MSLLGSIHDAAAPATAVEIAANRVSAATIEQRGGQPVVSAYAIEPLPDGALVPSLTTINTHNRTQVATALARVLDKVGRPRRIGLLIPDQVARVSIVRFEKVPGRAHDLEQLIRWQVKKAAPFPIEEAQVSHVPGIVAPDGHDFVVSVARRAVVEEYEALVAEHGAHPGIVDLSSFNVVNAVLGAANPPAADWLLVDVAADSASILIVRGGHVIFFRNRAADADGSLADLVHQSAMYYEDRLQGAGFTRVMLAGAGTIDADQARRSLEERLTTRVEAVDPRQAASLADRIAAAPQLLDALSPLVGLLLRDRSAVHDPQLAGDRA
ncbi:MAG TPA: pilus assembly protein PilM [Vicinamibacterales bacterium]|nr:pilus assembly protein PilM [Vicinamibacterales bacterium]